MFANRRQSACGLFPFRSERFEPVLNIRQFAVDLLCAPVFFVGLRLFQFGGEFNPARFKFLDFFFPLLKDTTMARGKKLKLTTRAPTPLRRSRREIAWFVILFAMAASPYAFSLAAR